MKGRIKRRLSARNADVLADRHHSDDLPVLCPLCERRIPPSQRDAHHLVPKSRGGTQTQWLHRICHRQIHALFNETELAQHYFSVERLLAHADVAKFVAWVQRKPDDFFERTRRSELKGQRARSG